MFIMIDGIDGSGKSTIMKFFIGYFKARGKKIFDVVDWSVRNNRIPEESDFAGADVLVTAEPTRVWIGAAIREEIISNNKNCYTSRHAAEAFALDRLILYNRVIIPAMKSGKIIIQDRGVSSSLAYQKLQDGKISLAELMALEGNKLALGYAPDFLILTKINPKIAMKRLNLRSKKRDDAIFEKLDFLTRLAKLYSGQFLRKIFEKRGAKVLEIDASKNKKEMRASVQKIIEKIFD